LATIARERVPAERLHVRLAHRPEPEVGLDVFARQLTGAEVAQTMDDLS
jgi:hypothetical protein